jgi:hypothetical protein
MVAKNRGNSAISEIAMAQLRKIPQLGHPRPEGWPVRGQFELSGDFCEQSISPLHLPQIPEYLEKNSEF